MSNLKKVICVDLDGTLCNNTYGNYKNAKPILKSIKKINQWYEQGNYILIYTARFMGTYKGNLKKVNEVGYNFTKMQIDAWGIKYNKLLLGKPHYDLIIDDKSIDYDENWND